LSNRMRVGGGVACGDGAVDTSERVGLPEEVKESVLLTAVFNAITQARRSSMLLARRRIVERSFMRITKPGSAPGSSLNPAPSRLYCLPDVSPSCRKQPLFARARSLGGSLGVLSSMQVLESSNDQNHADGKVESRGIDASKEAIGDDSRVVRLHAPRASHGVAQVAIHSQVASQGTGVVNVHNADMAMY
jgi:hypothetical protein